MLHLTAVLGDLIPSDHANQVKLADYLSKFLSSVVPGTEVLDLGCGDGALVESITAAYPAVRCVGIDIPDSPEVRERKAQRLGTFVTYDGTRMPFEASRFDYIVSRQVLEHVERPGDVFAEVARILKPGGIFFGSTSQLEPYHSYSTFNYTPYGIKRLGDHAGLRVVEFRPGADVLVLLARRMFRNRGLIDRWLDRESPLNFVIGCARLARWDPRRINCVKLMLAGQFYFVLRKPS